MAGPLMTSAALRSLLRELQDDLSRLRQDLEKEIAGVIGVDEYAEDEILDEKDDGSITVDVAELKSLFGRLDDASEAVDDAFKEFDQETDRLWRRFQRALVQHREGASP
jgi:hypothetical protein